MKLSFHPLLLAVLATARTRPASAQEVESAIDPLACTAATACQNNRGGSNEYLNISAGSCTEENSCSDNKVDFITVFEAACSVSSSEMQWMCYGLLSVMLDGSYTDNRIYNISTLNPLTADG